MTREEAQQQINMGTDPLLLSIQKWEDIVSFLTGADEMDEDEILTEIDKLQSGTYNCGLCIQYRESMASGSTDIACASCIVMLVTGQDSCLGTPYIDFADAHNVGADTETLLYYAEKELAFLRSLQ